MSVCSLNIGFCSYIYRRCRVNVCALNTDLLPIYLQVLLCEYVYVKYWLLSVNCTRVVVWIWVRWILSFGAIFTSVVVNVCKLNIGFCSCIYTCCLVNMCTLITSFCPYIYNCCRADMCIDTEFCRYVYKCCRVNVCTLNTGFCCYICKYRVNVCTLDTGFCSCIFITVAMWVCVRWLLAFVATCN